MFFYHIFYDKYSNKQMIIKTSCKKYSEHCFLKHFLQQLGYKIAFGVDFKGQTNYGHR